MARFKREPLHLAFGVQPLSGLIGAHLNSGTRMKYPLKAANGHAGEYFFAYQIAWTLKWPCRLIDVDIGIDAQVEVLDKDSTSTGRFVAFQIKASNDDEPDSRYVSHD